MNDTAKTLIKMGCPTNAANMASTMIKFSSNMNMPEELKECGKPLVFLLDYKPTTLVVYNIDELYIKKNKWILFTLLDDFLKRPTDAFQIWHGDWDQNVIQEVMKYSWITNKPKLNFLDVGIGTSQSVNAMKNILKNYEILLNVTGIDKNDDSDDVRKNNMKFIHADVIDVEFHDVLFDVVDCNALTYLTLPKTWPALIYKCASFLKSDGILLVESLNGNATKSALDVFEAKKFANYIKNMSASEFAWIMFVDKLFKKLECDQKLWKSTFDFDKKHGNIPIRVKFG